ncbi:hypothetical protein DFH05DRAFT_1459090 [Lentinula detonsa]|uniref:Uncharacterized protein n=1 Tax=Lentinula detonsa TaxID=2804962 RepID=A0A9W8TYM5_9AGAR|nr:hypothetical protein DFH05DRAFT_1406870 [Lentinula detonsa]KAJ3745275.1 hypothetical protein DFH05DRAFT_1459090 [Lentinula detonsa]
MADRLNFDPRNIPPPDFSSNTYATIRRALIADADSPGITTEAEAQQLLRDQWEEENGTLRAQYETQLEEDQAIAEARIEEAANEQRIKDAERKAREDELAKKAEGKRTPLYSFKQGVGVGHIRQQIHPYAKKLMTARKYVPLWYFLPEATAEAKERNREAIDNNRFQIAMDETDSSNSALTLVGSHTVRASPNAVPDSRLSWDQVMRAKSSFLNALSYGDFTNDFVKMFAGFYTGMDMHPELREEHGDKVLALYHAEMRRVWYEGFEQREPFDLAVFSEDTLEKCRIEIRRQNNEKAIKGEYSLLPYET